MIYMALPLKIKKPMKISIRQYIDNPYRGSGFLTSRKIIKQGLNLVFIKLLQKFRTQFYAVPYKYPNGDVLFYVRVPSEEHQFNKLHYDVLFLIENDPVERYSLRNIKMFSNSPNFLYTYAYVYYHDDLIIDRFASKIPSIAFTKPPEIRNPLESLGYEKSTYVAARYLLDGQLLNDSYINRFGKEMTAAEETLLFNRIADPEKIVQIYAVGRELQAKQSKNMMPDRKQTRLELRKEFMENSKKTKPRGSGILIPRAPRAKLTARKAKRSLMNE
jgi:hypothetical protein